MVSASLSGIAGAILAPILPQLALDKLLKALVKYLSGDEPSESSSTEVDKLRQLENEREALEDANLKLKIMQSEVRKLHKRDKQNMRLILINNKLRDVSYEIQDLEDDLEYMELQQKVEEINLQDETQMSQSRRRKRLSWFSWITGQSSDKRRRLSSSKSLKLSTDDLVNKMRNIVKQINCIDSEMNTEIKVDELLKQIALNGVYDPWGGQHQVKENQGRVTTSSINERKIYGRDGDIKRLTALLTKPINAVGNNISVVSIRGMGGIGKTALAQCVFNSQEIEDYFDSKVWVCVSDNYDRFRIIKEIIDSLSIDDDNTNLAYDTTSNLDLLETKLRKKIRGKKFLLVLDDVWSIEWQQLLGSLKSAQMELVKVLVTCRDPKVLGSLDGINRIVLEGLSGGECWSLFLNCVFADKNPDNYSKKLHDIGKQIVRKLNGSPLAVKTVGRLLGCSLTEKHWKDVLESDLWRLEIDVNDIMSALALSYYHLPQHLQLCFAFCSVFPKDFKYDMNNVIDMWIAHGYIQENGSSSKTMKDIGKEYYAELEAMCFFERNFPYSKMHDLARSISHGETYIYEGRKDEKISKIVGGMCAFLSHEAFKRIRVLVVFDPNMQEFPDTIANLKYLQYLDLAKTNIKSIPESLCGLYRLRVLKLPLLHTLPSLFHNLINLQEWDLLQTDNKIYLRRKLVYPVKKGGNYMITQLRNMNELRGVLSIEGLENIDNMKETVKAKLKEKHHIEELSLRWTNTVDGCKLEVQEEVLEALQPHPDLNYLFIEGYMGSKSPSWLMTLALRKLREIELNKCRNWASLPSALGLLPSLEKLILVGIENITIEIDDSMTVMFPSLRILVFRKATVSFQGMSSSSSSTTVKRCKLFPCLKALTIDECDGLNGLPWQMLSSLDNLRIYASPGLQSQVPGCLQSLNSLTLLEIKGLKIENTDIVAQQQQGVLLPNLRGIEIKSCGNIAFLLAVLLHVPSLERLSISKCSSVSLAALGQLSFLTYISLEEVEVTVVDITPVFPSLHSFELKKASMIIHNMPSSSVATKNHNCFPCLKSLKIVGCDELNVLQWPMLSALTHLYITNSPWVDDQFPGCLYGLSALTQLELTGLKVKTFPAEVMATLHALKYLRLEECNELISVDGLQALSCLTKLCITKCPQFTTWWFMEQITEQGVFHPNLFAISIDSCENLESLPAWLHCLPFLKSLIIINCPKIHSLPEGGLPSSLELLWIKECDFGLMERCQQEGSPDWLMIQHIRQRTYA
ncbi:putative disease resistance protein RGA3 [Dioscorea cayenensis subsp. rotundata]|uniref:Disease resistance protein RGA3 n=1 Tax=Dioscorea cayennensis subsp. rotundata TaxID=55577 RepID=A0AB40D2S2_DIOCR|nr:putative disease resistance protein RGA3 [Dioscorea cayenensis subsp. rotundata]